MKRYYSFLSVILICLQSSIGYADVISDKAVRLKLLYNKASTTVNRHNTEHDFFKEFPSNFSDFVALYGATEDTVAILYYDAANHIRFFMSLKNVDDSSFYQKLIAISIGGHWEADGVSYYQEAMRKFVLKNIRLTTQILQSKSDSDVYNFWRFYFDEPHADPNIDKRLKGIAAIDPDMYILIQKAHDFVIKDWKEQH